LDDTRASEQSKEQHLNVELNGMALSSHLLIILDIHMMRLDLLLQGLILLGQSLELTVLGLQILLPLTQAPLQVLFLGRKVIDDGMKL
jgi:hypothetical protein